MESTKYKLEGDIDKIEDFVAKRLLVLFLFLGIMVILALSEFDFAGYTLLFFLCVESFYIVKNKTIILDGWGSGPSWKGPAKQWLILKGTRAVILGVLFLIALTILTLLSKTNIIDLIAVANTPFQHDINFLNLAIGLVLGGVAAFLDNQIADKHQKVIIGKYNHEVINS